jgi:threonyl-tRNA synthetase
MSRPAATVRVALPDGSAREYDAGVTVEDVAYDIGPGLGDDCVAGVVDDDLVAREYSLDADCDLEVVTPSHEQYRRVLRHTAAHVLGQAIHRRYPDADLAIGPPTDDGFYYDVCGVSVDEDDLGALEAEMQAIVEDDYAIERESVSREDARQAYADNPYKREILDDEAAGEDTVSFYRQDGWRDLCRGPHVDSTGDVVAFELLSVSAAYWRGDEDRDTLTRISGTAFESEGALEEFLERRREAERRDHRRVGREMDLFSVPEHSPGCVHFHPNGMRMRRELESYIREHNDALGYEEVWTPELNRADLWKPTGHYEAFTEDDEMFVWEQDDEEYGLKPMNCANHAHLFDRHTHSYRDLPVRFSEFGTVYRNEQSGELSGLLRVRGFTQDDGHAFVRPDQIREEIRRTLQAADEMYREVGLGVHYKLETRGDDAIGSGDVWERAERALRGALDDEGLDYAVADGEAAFYGPKIGLDAEDALGREWTVGTIQLDFNIPERLDLSYVGADNTEHRPVVVHRALLGSIERFLGVLTEHFAGEFPTWLAPEQVRVLPVTDDDQAYAAEVADALGDVRVTVADTDETLGRRIRAGHDDNVPYMLVVGSEEAADRTVSLRDRREREREDVPLAAFRDALRDEVDQRRVGTRIISTLK